MKNLTKTLLAVLAAGLVTTALSTHEAKAAFISGDIGLGGAVTFDAPLLTAHTVTQWRDSNGNLPNFSTVQTRSGDFGSISIGQQVTMAPSWTFNPSTMTNALFSVGGFTFKLLSATIVNQTATFLNVTGTGILSKAGFQPTAASWAFTIPFAGGTDNFFPFSAQLTATGQGAPRVPDGGSAVALLGISLVAIEFVRRKLGSRD